MPDQTLIGRFVRPWLADKSKRDPNSPFRKRLSKLLYDNLPNHRSDRYDDEIVYAKLAKDLGVSAQSVTYWFEKEKLSHRQLQKLTELPGSTLTLEMLYPFCVRK